MKKKKKGKLGRCWNRKGQDWEGLELGGEGERRKGVEKKKKKCS